MTGLFKQEHLPIWVILILGFLVRVIGIHFGLPDLYHADEPIIVNHAVAYGTGDLNPHFFKIPPLVSYLLFICYGVYYVLGRAVGWFSSIEDFQILFLSNPTSFYLIGRIIFGALCGTVTIYVFYRLLGRFFSRAHAILGGLLFAFSFLHVRDSHYIYVDISLLLVLVAAYFPIFKILESERGKDYIWFGILLGIAVATKYNGIFILVPFLAAHFLRGEQNRFRVVAFNLLITAVISLIVCSLLNPFSWIDFNFFFNELQKQSGAEAFVGPFHHLTYSLNGGLGFPLLMFAILGIIVSFFKPDSKRLLLLSFILVYYLVLCFFSQPYDRYVLPLLPFMIIFAVDGLLLIKKKFDLSNLITLFLALVLALPSAVKIYFSDLLFLKKDIRTVAREWIEENIPRESKIALGIPFYMPRLRPSSAQLEEKQEEAEQLGGIQQRRIELLMKQAREDTRPRYHLFFMNRNSEEGFLFSKPVVPYDVEYLKRHEIQYVVLSQLNKDYAAEFRKNLEAQGKLLVTFNPYRNSRQEWAVDEQPLTGGPFLWKDLVVRERNGQILKVFRLK